MMMELNEHLIDLRTDDLLTITICPVTGEEVIEAEQQQLSVFNEPLVWWHCPVCAGWHVSLPEAKKYGFEL
jgi:lipopolysaccharide biosynthesis regulator YciM